MQFFIDGTAIQRDCSPQTFLWAPDVTPGAKGESSPIAGEVDARLTSMGDNSVDNRTTSGAKETWELSVAVPPSKAVRDGVRFQGLGVLLFSVDDEVRFACFDMLSF